jgi:Protein of unknown function (DUF1566)
MPKSMWMWGVVLMVALMAVGVGGLLTPTVAKKPGPPPGPPSPVPKTGQTQCWDEFGVPIPCVGTGQDGAIQAGVAWPLPRFIDHSNGTVTDNLTGLIWLKVRCHGGHSWPEALDAANVLAHGQCGLTDGSMAGDWRVPNIKELHSLLDFGQIGPTLPAGHPFVDVAQAYYWSSTTFASAGDRAFVVSMATGESPWVFKSNLGILLWPVRGGD